MLLSPEGVVKLVPPTQSPADGPPFRSSNSPGLIAGTWLPVFHVRADLRSSARLDGHAR